MLAASRMLTLAAVALLGCGRVGYDPLCTDCELAPSNDIPLDLLEGALGPLIVDEPVLVHTDTGEIETAGGALVRGAGPGIEGGIHFELLDTGNGIGVLAASSIELGPNADLRARGRAALALVAAGSITIAGRIDVSAGLCPDGTEDRACGGPGGGNGAASGVPAGGCAPGGDGVEDGDTGGGGGGLGGDGAAGGDETDEMRMPGGLGGVVSGRCPGRSLEPLLGGSGGGHSGGASADDAISVGGGGGGAVQITSFTGIVFTGGGVLAAGAGGAALGEDEGGGGGGSGGAILIEAPAIALGSAALAANGGGGGQGDDLEDGASGGFGKEPAPGGGADISDGNAGGNGGAAGSPPTTGEVDINDTGGGGGSVGIIRIRATEYDPGSAVISPAPALGM